MTFYIAERNKETGKFELWHSDNKVTEMHDDAKAIDAYEMAIRLEGTKNILLLESVITDIKLSVTRWEPPKNPTS